MFVLIPLASSPPPYVPSKWASCITMFRSVLLRVLSNCLLGPQYLCRALQHQILAGRHGLPDGDVARESADVASPYAPHRGVRGQVHRRRGHSQRSRQVTDARIVAQEAARAAELGGERRQIEPLP